jgi:hypothetical protein
MMTENAIQAFGALSRDTKYSDNVGFLVGGGGKKGFCAVPECKHLEMELLHKCTSWRRIWQEKMIASMALIIAIQVSGFNVCCIQTKCI